MRIATRGGERARLRAPQGRHPSRHQAREHPAARGPGAGGGLRHRAGRCSAAGGTRMTETGLSLGTPQYMSPEQAMGERRSPAASDIYALGCVLYEMLSGDPPFTGSTAQAIVAQVMTESPRPMIRRAGTPCRRTSRRRCCARWRSCRRTGSRRRPSSRRRWRRRRPQVTRVSAAAVPTRRSPAVPWTPVLALALPLAAGLAWYFGRPRSGAQALVASLLPPPGCDFDLVATSNVVQLSPDGGRLAFVAVCGEDRSIWVRAMDTGENRELGGTAGAIYPFWSADGRSLGFFAAERLKRIEVEGGAIRDLAPAPDGRGGSWSADGTILYAPDVFGVMYRIPAEGGTPEAATQLAQSSQGISQRLPHFLPDGKHFLFAQGASTGAEGQLMAGTLGSLESKTGARPRLQRDLRRRLPVQRVGRGAAGAAARSRRAPLERKGRRGGLGPRDLGLPIPRQLPDTARCACCTGGGPARGADRVVRSRSAYRGSGGAPTPRCGSVRTGGGCWWGGPCRTSGSTPGFTTWPRGLEPAHAEVRVRYTSPGCRTAGRWCCSRRAATARNSCRWTAPRSRWSRRSPTTPDPGLGARRGFAIGQRQVQETGFDLVRWSGVRDSLPNEALSATPADERSPRVSPDGRYVAYFSTRAAARRSTSRGCQGRPASGRSHSRGPSEGRVALAWSREEAGALFPWTRGRAAVGSCGHRAGAAARQTEHGAGGTGQHQRDRSGARRAAAAAVQRPVNRCAAYPGGELDGTSW